MINRVVKTVADVKFGERRRKIVYRVVEGVAKS